MSQGVEKLLQLSDVELAFSHGSAKERRKYLTLIEETSTTRRGGLGETVRVRTTTSGERLACKKLLLPDRAAFGSRDAYETEVEHRERAFREEYDALCRLSSFKGFVKAHAYGRVGNRPLILMEWVEGISVGNAAQLMSKSSSGKGADPLFVAQVGRDVFHLLARLESETELFVHRDLSASNIMIRTSGRPFKQQVADGYYDICLIDFGSAATLRAGDGAFTTDTRILRGATPGYAPPEMLSNDLPGLEELRKSTKIDVYAASSVLYEMLCGHLPFDVAGRTGSGSDYLFKMMNDPEPTGFAPGSAEELLASTICRGICATQDARCSSYAMYKMLEFYVGHYEENMGRAGHGEQLVSLNPRSIDRPDFDDQISLSNPLANNSRGRHVQVGRASDTTETVALDPEVVARDSALRANAQPTGRNGSSGRVTANDPHARQNVQARQQGAANATWNTGQQRIGTRQQGATGQTGQFGAQQSQTGRVAQVAQGVQGVAGQTGQVALGATGQQGVIRQQGTPAFGTGPINQTGQFPPQAQAGQTGQFPAGYGTPRNGMQTIPQKSKSSVLPKVAIAVALVLLVIVAILIWNLGFAS